jgi:hypothetical protein
MRQQNLFNQLQRANRQYMNFAGENQAVQVLGNSPAGIVTGGVYAPGVSMFSFTVRRLTNNIVAALPVIVGFAGGLMNRFGILSRYLPAGTTVAVSGGVYGPANFDRLRFTFTNGADVDIVDVTCKEVEYPYFLGLQPNNPMKTNLIKATISDPSQQQQFAESIKMVSLGFGGQLGEQSFTPNDFATDARFQNGQIDMPISVPFDQQNGIVPFITDVANFAITLTCTVAVVGKIGTNAL